MNLFERFAPLATWLVTTFCMPMALAALPQAVVADPIRNEKYPALNQQMLIPSGGLGMNALLMRASGSGPKPTLVLLHGLPGNEQNLDLAQAVRRAGWNVLTMHYRGSWGSPGNFSIEGAVQDAEAAMTFLRQPENAAKHHIDPRRLFIGGHSMGGFAAARYAAAHPDVAGLLLIDAWNVGADGKNLLAHPETRAALVADVGDDLGNSLAGTDAAHLVDEIERHAQDWDLMTLASAPAIPPTLVIGASRGGGAENKTLADALRRRHFGKVTSITMNSDHAFSDHRIALSVAVVNWLRRETTARPSSASR